jgi:hypothetical protein
MLRLTIGAGVAAFHLEVLAQRIGVIVVIAVHQEFAAWIIIFVKPHFVCTIVGPSICRVCNNRSH